jgi:hypothetical protein
MRCATASLLRDSASGYEHAAAEFAPRPARQPKALLQFVP